MKFLIFTFLVSISAVNCANTWETLMSEWNTYKLTYGKEYGNIAEELYRLKVYQDNKDMVDKHNEEARWGLHTFTLGINQFSDMTHKEILDTMTGFNMDAAARNSSRETQYLPPENVKITANSVDWRDKGYVTPVKSQGRCGSCWAFSAAGAMEGQHFRATGKLVSLSEQNLVECDTKCHACSGGIMDSAFVYVIRQGGIDTENSYPYTSDRGHVGRCKFSTANIGAKFRSYKDIHSERNLETAVATVGPVSIAMDVSDPKFGSYSGGIYSSTTCSASRLNHAMLIVGYGNGYWIVKNSWATWWGDQGYIKVAKGSNMCGIASMASYPVV